MTAQGTAIEDYQLDLFRRVKERWRFGLNDPYDTLRPLRIERRHVLAYFTAAEACWRIFARMGRLLHDVPREVTATLGYHPALRQLCFGSDTFRPPLLTRVDLVRTAGGVKLLDFNSDAPGLIFDALVVNGFASCRTGENPNAYAGRRLQRALTSCVRDWCALHPAIKGTVGVRCAYDSRSDEQRGFAELLVSLLGPEYDARAVECVSISATTDGAVDDEGHPIHVLIRCCPLISFLRRRECGRRTGRRILELSIANRICVVNGTDGYVLESKALQALIWALYERHIYFTPAQRDAIGRHFLPTYRVPPRSWRVFVEKPLTGSCGDGVRVQSRRDVSPGFDRVYQRYIRLPERSMDTELGRRRLTPVISCVMAGGKAIGLIARAGGKITDLSAWNVPIVMR